NVPVAGDQCLAAHDFAGGHVVLVEVRANAVQAGGVKACGGGVGLHGKSQSDMAGWYAESGPLRTAAALAEGGIFPPAVGSSDTHTWEWWCEPNTGFVGFREPDAGRAGEGLPG